MKKNEKKGIWIPIEILNDKNLDSSDKILLSEIYSLINLPNGCFAPNKYFRDLLGITSGAASKRITALKEKGYIETKNVYDNKACQGRIITRPKNQKSIEDNVEVIQRGGSLGNQDPVSVKPIPTSLSTNGVLPEGPEPTSFGKPINTIINTDIEKQYNYSNTLNEPKESVDDTFNFQDEFISNPSGNNNFQQIIIENTSSTESKKYTGVSQSGPMTSYQYTKLQFENARDYLAEATSLGADIFNYANEKRYFLLKDKLEPSTFADIILPMKHYMQARKNLGLDKK